MEENEQLELIDQYSSSLKVVDELISRIPFVEVRVTEEYDLVEKEIGKKVFTNKEDELDYKYLSNMKSDLNYAIKWIKTGIKPGPKRGIERRSQKQKEIMVDPLILVKIKKFSHEEKYFFDEAKEEKVLTDEEKNDIEIALSRLTKRQKEIYLMRESVGMTNVDIADALSLKVKTVKDELFISRKKIAREIRRNILLSNYLH